MRYGFKLIYFYQHVETGRVCQRTFSLGDIKEGADDAHLKLLPGYQLIDINPGCKKYSCVYAGKTK